MTAPRSPQPDPTPEDERDDASDWFPTSPDPSEAAVTEGPQDFIKDEFVDAALAMTRTAADHAPQVPHDFGLAMMTHITSDPVLLATFQAAFRQPSAPERPDLTAANASERERLAYGRGLNHKAIDGSHIASSESEFVSANGADVRRSEGSVEDEPAVTDSDSFGRAEQVERPSLDVERLAELRELAGAASDAPWAWLDGDDADPENPGDELQDGHGEMVATGFRDQVLRDGDGRVTDGRFVAALRNAWPAIDAALSGAASPAERTRE